MTITYRDGSTGTTSLGTLQVTVPATVQAGDLILIHYTTALSTSTTALPSGYAYVPDSSPGVKTVGNSLHAAIYKIATGGDAGATVDLSVTGTACKQSCVLNAWAGVDPTTPIHKAAFTGNTTPSGTTQPTPTVTTTLDNCVIVIGLGTKDSSVNTITKPAGYTDRGQVIQTASGRANTARASKDGATAGSYGGESWTTDATPSLTGTWTFAIAALIPTQTARPASDITASNSTGVPDATHHYSDLAASADTSYIEMTSGGFDEVKFAALVDPVSSTGHTITYRACYAGGATSATLQAQVKQGATVIATFSHSLTGSFQTFTDTLSGAQADSITDYTDLRVRFTVTAVA